MRQARRHSAYESVINVAVGYIIGLLSQIVVFPVFDIHISFSSNLAISGWFTAISIVRSYVIRRYFTGGIA
jgi:hypothetical protein